VYLGDNAHPEQQKNFVNNKFADTSFPDRARSKYLPFTDQKPLFTTQ
jgi:hypothetical protein